jgi:hypothetical protein
MRMNFDSFSGNGSVFIIRVTIDRYFNRLGKWKSPRLKTINFLRVIWPDGNREKSLGCKQTAAHAQFAWSKDVIIRDTRAGLTWATKFWGNNYNLSVMIRSNSRESHPEVRIGTHSKYDRHLSNLYNPIGTRQKYLRRARRVSNYESCKWVALFIGQLSRGGLNNWRQM